MLLQVDVKVPVAVGVTVDVALLVAVSVIVGEAVFVLVGVPPTQFEAFITISSAGLIRMVARAGSAIGP